MASNLDRYRDTRYHARPPKGRKIKPYAKKLRSGGRGLTLDPGQRKKRAPKMGQALHSYKKPPQTPVPMGRVQVPLGVPSGSIEKGTFKYTVYDMYWRNRI